MNKYFKWNDYNFISVHDTGDLSVLVDDDYYSGEIDANTAIELACAILEVNGYTTDRVAKRVKLADPPTRKGA